MTLASRLCSPCGDLMIGTFAPRFSMLLWSWMLTVWPIPRVSTVNGWIARSFPFKGTSQNLLWSLSHFAMPLDKAGPIPWLILLLTVIRIDTTLIISWAHTHFETTHISSYVFDAGILGTGRDHALQPNQANPRAPLSQGGRIISSYQSK